MRATKEIKQWFGQGEYDVDLMIACGAVTEAQIVEMYNREVVGVGVEGDAARQDP